MKRILRGIKAADLWNRKICFPSFHNINIIMWMCVVKNGKFTSFTFDSSAVNPSDKLIEAMLNWDINKHFTTSSALVHKLNKISSYIFGVEEVQDVTKAFKLMARDGNINHTCLYFQPDLILQQVNTNKNSNWKRFNRGDHEGFHEDDVSSKRVLTRRTNFNFQAKVVTFYIKCIQVQRLLAT